MAISCEPRQIREAGRGEIRGLGVKQGSIADRAESPSSVTTLDAMAHLQALRLTVAIPRLSNSLRVAAKPNL